MKSNIRKLRNEKNITQTTLAKVLGKTQQTVSHMENDRDRISIECLITMANYFGVSTDCVLGIDSGENIENTKEKEDKKTENTKTVLSGTNDFQRGVENLKINSAGENKKILYQLILSLLLFSLDDDAAAAQTLQKQQA